MTEKTIEGILTELVRITGYYFNKPHTAEMELKWISQARTQIVEAIREKMPKKKIFVQADIDELLTTL